MLTPRPETLLSWDGIPENEKPFQRRPKEVYAGFTGHANYNSGRVIDEIYLVGYGQNALNFYMRGDDGSRQKGWTPPWAAY